MKLDDLKRHLGALGLPTDVRIEWRRKTGDYEIAAFGGETGGLRGYLKLVDSKRTREILEKWRQLRPKDGPFGPGVRPLVGGDGVLFLWPNDGALRDLPSIVDPQKLKRLLGESEAVCPKGFRIRGEKSHLTELRYKPELRYVLRADLALKNDSTGEKRRVVVGVKVRDRRRGSELHAASRQLRAAVPHGRLVASLDVLGGGAIEVESWVWGRDLETALHAGQVDARTIGDLFADLRASAAAGLERTVDPGERARELVQKALDTLDLLAPLDAAAARRRCERWHAAAACLGERPPTFVHGDLHPKQILMSERGAVLIDLDTSHVGDHREDLGLFLAHLDRLRSERPELASRIDAVAAAAGDEDASFHRAVEHVAHARREHRLFGDDGRAAIARHMEIAEGLIGNGEHSPTPSYPSAFDRSRFDRGDLRLRILWPRSSPPWPALFDGPEAADLRHGALIDPATDIVTPLEPETDAELPALGEAARRGRLVAWRPGRRATVEITVGADTRYLKIEPPRRAQESARRHRIIAGLARGTALVVASLLDVDPARGTATFARAPGEALHAILGRGIDPAVLRRVGRGIAALHALPPTEEFPRDVDDFPTPERRWLECVPSIDPRAWTAVIDALKERRRAADEGAIGVVHGDLHDKNIFDDGDALTLIDIGGAHVGRTDIEAANLAAHFVLRALQRGERNEPGAAHVDIFIDAYLGAGARAEPGVFAAAIAATLLRLSVLYLFRPAQDDLSPSLIAESRRWLRRS